MKTSAQEMSDAAFANLPGVKLLKSGRWAARIHHPTTKIWVLVGIYSTPQEAADSCTRKKLKYDSCSLQEIPSYIDKNQSIRRMRSRKWTPDNKHKLKSVWPGTFITPNSTKNGCLRMKEGSSISRGRSVRGSGCVYQVKSGNWQAAMKMRNVRHYLGTYQQLKRAQEAINHKRCDLLVLNTAANQRPHRGTKTSSGRWQIRIMNPITKNRVCLGTFDTAVEAEEAYNNKKSEFDLMVRAQKKRKQSNDRFEGENSACLADDD